MYTESPSVKEKPHATGEILTLPGYIYDYGNVKVKVSLFLATLKRNRDSKRATNFKEEKPFVTETDNVIYITKVAHLITLL